MIQDPSRHQVKQQQCHKTFKNTKSPHTATHTATHTHTHTHTHHTTPHHTTPHHPTHTPHHTPYTTHHALQHHTPPHDTHTPHHTTLLVWIPCQASMVRMILKVGESDVLIEGLLTGLLESADTSDSRGTSNQQ